MNAIGRSREFSISFLLFLFILVWAFYVPMTAYGEEAKGNLAPLNPEFLEYTIKIGNHKLEAEPVTVEHAKGRVPSPLDLSHLRGMQLPVDRSAATLPSSYDLRTAGKLTPVKDQGNCGACWTFATTASLESNLLPSETLSFSENNINNTNGFDYGPCNGGSGSMATAYLARWSGPILETADPYGTTYDGNPSPSPTGLSTTKHVQEVIFIPGRADALDNNNIKQFLMQYGVIDTSMMMDQSNYFDSTGKNYYYNGNKPADHDVAIVGWDDNFDKSKFKIKPPGNGAFIIRNSWGTSFGDNGYFYISYYDTVVGNDTNYLFNGSQPVTNYSRVYQYDPLGSTGAWGFDNETAWFANVFTAQANESLAAISFYTGAVNSSYEAYIYTGVSSSPTSGTPAATQKGLIPWPGYHTLTLTSPVSLVSGQKFSVVVKLTTPGNNYPIPLEGPVSNYSSQATAQAGQSYMSSDGGTWTDLTADTDTANTNVCLKAFTSGSTPCSYSLSSNGQAFGSQGASGSVTVSAGGSCPWTAISSVSWITLSASGGSGNGTMTFSVAINSSPTARTANLTIAGQTFVVSQAGSGAATQSLLQNGDFESGIMAWTEYDSLDYELITNDNQDAHKGAWFGYLGGDYGDNSYIYQDVKIPSNSTQVLLQFWYFIATDDTSKTDDSDMTVYVVNPTDNSVLQTLDNFSNLDQTNSGWVHSGQYDLTAYAGQKVRLVFYAQDDQNDYTSFLVDDISLIAAAGTSCSYTISPSSQSVGGSGGTGTINVTSSGSCGWTASTSAAWITILSGSSGTGNGSVNYQVSAYSTSAARTGTILAAGKPFIVNQSGSTAGNSGGTFVLSVYKAGTGGGTVKANTGTISWSGNTGTGSYSSGTGVTLTATADAGSTFTSWSGCDSTSGNTCVVTMTATKSVTATFASSANSKYSLSVSESGGGTGTVTSSPAGISCGSTCTAPFNPGTVITLTATPAAGVNFGGWTGDTCTGTGTCSVTLNNNITVTADFRYGSFDDEPNNGYAPYIEAIKTAAITTGCGNGDYCPSQNVTRGQMAAFIIRALYGETFTYTTSPYFTDEPSTDVFFKYIQKMKDTGITSVTGTYNPNDFVPRNQMAAFLVRATQLQAKQDTENFTYTTQPFFTDEPATDTYFKYIQKLRDKGITTVTGTYNPTQIVTRDMMAAFLSRAFLGMK